MRILEINIQNFRKLLQCHIEFSEKTTLFVGANNSGKTSAMDALGKFLADRNFTFNDITISERSAINVIGERWIQKDCEEPTTITEWESLMPKMDIWLNVASNEMHYVACIIPTLKWRGGKLGGQDDRAAFYPPDGTDTADFADGGRGENRPHACGGTVLLEERRAGKPLCHDGERRSNALTLTGTADETVKPERAA